MNFLVDGFDVFGVHIQNWMPLAIVVAALAVAISVRARQQ
jgi:hypothetical protein